MVRSESTAKPAELSFLDEPGRIKGRGGRRRDLTRRLETKPARRRRAANLQALFNTIQDYIWVVDSEGRILWFNQAVVERLGYAAEELVGQSLLAVHPDDRPEAADIWAELVAGGKDEWNLPVQTKNGNLIPVETKFTRGRWLDQKALFAVSRDITLRRRLEAHLIQSAKLASLGVIAEGIAHEIRSPLTVCSSAAQFILEDGLDPEFRRLCLEKMLSGIAKASAVIENFLKFARALIEQHPASIEVQSTLGQSTSFTVRLAPRQEARRGQ